MAELTPEEREKLERALAELGEHQATADVLRRQLNLLAASLSELSLTSETIRTLKNLKPETEILVPLGSDSFVTAKLALQDRVIAGMGAGVAAERTVEEALRALETRMVEVGGVFRQAQAELEKIGERFEALRPEVERLLAKAKKG